MTAVTQISCFSLAEPTNEARAEAKLAWILPCKEEEDDSQTAEIIDYSPLPHDFFLRFLRFLCENSPLPRDFASEKCVKNVIFLPKTCLKM